jgi:predicted anti-sigma-YlaC factor YlaD
MKPHNPELVGALLDGELKGLRRVLVQRHVDRCALCAAEYHSLHRVREMLAANSSHAQMSDSPEFFWSKVKREIQARGDQRVELPGPQLSAFDWPGQHRYALATMTATLVAVIALIWMIQARRPAPTPVIVTVALPIPRATVEHVSTAIPDTVATTVDTKDTDVTVIWVSGLPWTPNMTEMKTVFANLDT